MLLKNEIDQCFEYVNNELWRKSWTNKNGVTYPSKVVKNVASDAHGYCRFRFNFRIVRYHVVVYILMKGEIPDNMVVDHIDGNKLNNHPDNLRLTSCRQNLQNTHKHRAGKLPGTTYRKDRNKWHSRIRIGKTLIHLGSYNTEEEAHKAYLHYIEQKRLA
jgi:hypothetical protein